MVPIHKWNVSQHKKKYEIVQFSVMWINQESIMLRELILRTLKTQNYLFHM